MYLFEAFDNTGVVRVVVLVEPDKPIARVLTALEAELDTTADSACPYSAALAVYGDSLLFTAVAREVARVAIKLSGEFMRAASLGSKHDTARSTVKAAIGVVARFHILILLTDLLSSPAISPRSKESSVLSMRNPTPEYI